MVAFDGKDFRFVFVAISHPYASRFGNLRLTIVEHFYASVKVSNVHLVEQSRFGEGHANHLEVDIYIVEKEHSSKDSKMVRRFNIHKFYE